VTENEADEIVKFVQTLWPDWKPGDPLRYEWSLAIARLDDPNLAREAVRTHLTETNFSRPTLAKIVAAYSRLASGRSGASGLGREAPEIGRTNVYVVCVTPPANFPGRLGRTVEVIYPLKSQVPHHDEVMRLAERYRQKMENVYGGTWETVDYTTTGRDGWPELQAERRRRQKEAMFP
jgi:hypothetical protein